MIIPTQATMVVIWSMEKRNNWTKTRVITRIENTELLIGRWSLSRLYQLQLIKVCATFSPLPNTLGTLTPVDQGNHCCR